MEYKKIRAEKDATVSFSLTTNEQLLPLQGRQLQLIMHTPTCRDVDVPFTVKGDKISFSFCGKQIGQHTFSVYENRSQKGSTAVDLECGIEVVSKTWQEGGEAVEGLDVESISLGVANLAVGVKGDDGDSAYEVAVKNGFKGTESEWLESLKADATKQIEAHDKNPESHHDIRTKLSELEGETKKKLSTDIYNKDKEHFAKDTDIQTLEKRTEIKHGHETVSAEAEMVVDLNEEVVPGMMVVPEAPQDDKEYVRMNGGWKENTPPPGGFNRALYEAAGAVFNEQSGFYELNGLTDITVEEMGSIYSTSKLNNAPDNDMYFLQGNQRTYIVRNNDGGFSGGLSFNRTFGANSRLTVANLSDSKDFVLIGNIESIFYRCMNLRTVITTMGLSYIRQKIAVNSFKYCLSLTNLKLKDLRADITLVDSSLLSKKSILYMIQNSAATSDITITLHPTAYAMAMADPDIQAALKEKTFVSLAEGVPEA